METTRRFWTVAASGLFLALWGVVVAQPLAVFGSAAVAAWLLARQYRFVQAAGRVPAGLTANLLTDRRVMARESSQLSLDAALDGELPVTVAVSVTPPVGATGEPATVTLDRDERHGLAQTTLAWPVAGSFRVEDVTATITDGAGLFRQTVALDVGVDVAVDPRAPRDLHVGEGGQAIAAGFGDHETGRSGGDVEPAEVREYVPGDAIRQIDWKATARLDKPHIREFEGQTERQTILFFDHRATMADGRPGTRKLDYARQVAVGVVEQAAQSGDQVGYYAVGDDGLTETVSPTARVDTWRPVRDSLQNVEPTTPNAAGLDPVRPASVRDASAELDGGGSTFDRTLAPYFAARDAYRRQFDARPLYQAVTNGQFATNTAIWTVIVTDDANRAELREAVKHARIESDQVTVFMTPTALFADPDMDELDQVYDRYADFEEFRQELANVARVSAYEVGPADRLAGVLSAGRQRRRGKA